MAIYFKLVDEATRLSVPYLIHQCPVMRAHLVLLRWPATDDFFPDLLPFLVSIHEILDWVLVDRVHADGDPPDVFRLHAL